MDDEVAAILHSLDEAKARRLLEDLGTRSALRQWERDCAVRYALRLHRARTPRRTIVERLLARYEFSERTAYTVVDEMLRRFAESRVGFAESGTMIEADDGG
jgi:hypothetical protein